MPLKYFINQYLNIIMKKQLLLLVFTLLATISFGQGKFQDVIYLKDGSEIRGMIIEEVPNELVKIKTAFGSVYVYQLDVIEKITKEKYSLPSSNTILNTGMQVGVGYRSSGVILREINIIRSYQTKKDVAFGFGSGLRFGDEGVFLPFYADVTGNFIKGNTSNFISFNIGYLLDVSEGIDAFGLMTRLSSGFKFYNSFGNAFYMGAGFEFARSSTDNFSPWGGYEQNTEVYSAIFWNLGICF